uniref:NADH-ubiquinone oxidoreductase chain 5 n=1 Tax=Paphnutius ruficeps TaxID=1035836 RepID=M9MTI4_9HEMI|nr:NADH dehydrogenase subunit 5 [Paphnutius ruficeps]AEG64529.1 NADH dehydrogenase subunit 5 [Paphnutius ruficeps]
MIYKLDLSFFMFLMFILSGMMFFCFGIFVIIDDKMYMFEWSIMNLNSVYICMSIILDWMSLIFMSFVLIISSFVIFYSKEYMDTDINKTRFFYLVLMFVLSMMLLIISPNLVSILLGWDGLGLISYCLVIYYQNFKSYNAGMITSLTNRIGDLALLMSIAWMMDFGSWHYLFYLQKMNFSFIILMIILAAFTKSAQIPFSSWLPAAMAAPTPVSALVHSSTLVTAGVYLLIRFNLMIFNFKLIDLFIMLSLMTMIMSSVGANFEFDLKKIIALSTLSQLGFMMATLMLGFPTMAFFHLLTHALFKSSLFMCAGVIIHCMWGNQDIRYMGGLIIQMPVITSCMNISNLALCGFPFLAGFYSKDLIMEYMMMSSINMLFFTLFMLSIGLTIMYSLRLSYYSLSGDVNLLSYMSIHDCSKFMMSSIVLMSMMTIFGGSLMSWLIFKTPNLVFLPLDLKISVLVLIIIGGYTGYSLNFVNYMFNMNSSSSFFLGSMWFLPMFSTYFLTNGLLNFSILYFKLIDQGWGEHLGGYGMSNYITNSSKLNQVIQMNNFSIYMMSFMIWMIFIMIFID